jgi:hypothetical protein
MEQFTQGEFNMANVTYIKKSIPKQYVEFETPLNPEEYNNIGTTWQDYLDNKWVRLSDAQVSFRNEHPTATVKEVWDMRITPTPPRTLEQAKQEKVALIEEYDNSDTVNGFDIVMGEDTMTAWIHPEQRANYKNSLDSAELLGLEEVHPVFNGIQLTLETAMAKMALAQIQIYADRCFIVTETHKAAVEALETIEAVDAYDNTTGYPERLVFTIDASKAASVEGTEE